MILNKWVWRKSIILLLGIGVIQILPGCADTKEQRNPQQKISPKENKKEKQKNNSRKRVIESRTVYTSSTADIDRVLKELDYSLKRWNAGVREIPRLYLTDISARWQTQSQKIDVKTKKAIFFQLSMPLVLRANELLKAERQQLITLSKDLTNLEKNEQQWLTMLAKKYKLLEKDEQFQHSYIDELLLRVDVIPPSLALAQSAEESGWGTSRFAILGNSLFGQWAFSKDAMRPMQQRKELGDYGLARFDTPQDAVNSYMRNLNTHRAYTRLRQLRSHLSKEGKKVTGYELAKTLDKYSERGQAYVESLHAMMRINHLGEADDAYLWDKEIIYLTPVEDKR